MNFLLLAENLFLNKLITVSWDYLAMDFFCIFVGLQE